MRIVLGLAAAAGLGLALWLPLVAQEATPPATAPAAPDKPVVPADEQDAAAPNPDEAVSADNNISFPVDI
jgi:hypothetical protein